MSKLRSVLPPGPLADKPGTIAAMSRLQQHAANKGKSPDATPTTPVSQELRESVSVGVPLEQPNTLKRDDIFRNLTSLPVDRIDLYSDNPRSMPGTHYNELKESIRAQGIKQPFTVTRRPNAANYVVSAGGNSRLRAVKELYAETGDKRFAFAEVIETPYTNELQIFADHIVENNERDPLSFWDSAKAFDELKRRIEKESGKPLGLRTSLDAFKAYGVNVDFTSLGYSLFAVQRLSFLGTAVHRLSIMAVRRLQPELNKLVRLLERSGQDEEGVYRDLLHPVFARYASHHVDDGKDSLDEDELLSMCSVAVAERLQVSSSTLQTMLALAEQFRELTWAELDQRARQSPQSATLHRKIGTSASAPREHAGVAEAAGFASTAIPAAPSMATSAANPQTAIDEFDALYAADTANRFDHRTLHRYERDTLCDFLLDKVALFATAHGMAACVRRHAPMPYGFYVEVPGAAWPFDAEYLSKPSPRFAWWTLATIAQQWQAEHLEQLPDDSMLRRLYDQQQDGDIGMVQGDVSAQTGGMADHELLLTCLTDATTVGQEALADILAMVRAIGIIDRSSTTS
jgi:ParB family protein of integrating conjugative element (PFGI_1 class)